jgi:alkylation response protein AidB-like acyl-CoA dehydrogenase
VAHDIPALVQTVRTFVREELIPLEPRFLARPFRELLPVLAEKRQQVRRLDLWAPYLPREVGGAGLSLPAYARLSEEMGRTPIGHYVFGCQAPDVGNIELLLRHGTPAQRERYLAPLVRGDIRSCFAMTEPGRAGSNPVWLETTARRDGDDYVIDGRKWFATAADGAAFAIVMAVTDPDAKPHRRASQILVPTDTPGWTLLRNIPVMGHTGEDFFSHGEVALTGCRVPVSNRLGEEGSGFALAQERLGPGRIHHAMRWIGVAERALDLHCARAAARELRPGVPLASRQSVQHDIAESRAEIDAARLLVLDTAERIDRSSGRSPSSLLDDGPLRGPVEAEGQAARTRISLIKFYVAGVLDRVLDRALQAHGALGLTDDTVLASLWRHERAARIYDGPDEVHKSVVAREVLKPYGVSVEV